MILPKNKPLQFFRIDRCCGLNILYMYTILPAKNSIAAATREKIIIVMSSLQEIYDLIGVQYLPYCQPRSLR
jgi:hypothetical protein